MNIEKITTPIFAIKENRLYIKREDFIPISFGGNKARKAELFFEEIDRGPYDCVVTYGSSSSNHCRIIANMAAMRRMRCCIISPDETQETTYNRKMMNMFGAEIILCPINAVSRTIDDVLEELKACGFTPFFIEGGGHGNIGTQAYVNCYEEICKYEKDKGIFFDYIFHASGTGTTQAGLICGQLMKKDNRKIVGISIARKNPRGREVVLDSVRSYCKEYNIKTSDTEIEQSTFFVDDYVGLGYGTYSEEIENCIKNVMVQYGIPLDMTYTGKAFAGMEDYLKKNGLAEEKVLFIHTGGTPLFFDYMDNYFAKNE